MALKQINLNFLLFTILFSYELFSQDEFMQKISTFNDQNKNLLRKGHPESKLPFLLHHGKKTEKVAILVHGFNGSPAVMKDIGDIFHKLGYNVVSILLPGHGRDKKDMNHATSDMWINEVKSAISNSKALGNKVVLVGHSLGGALALLASQQKRGEVHGTLLLDPLIQMKEKYQLETRLSCAVKLVFEDLAHYVQLKSHFGINYGADHVRFYPPCMSEITQESVKVNSMCEVYNILADLHTQRDYLSPNIPLALVTSNHRENALDIDETKGFIEYFNLESWQYLSPLHFTQRDNVHHGSLPTKGNPFFKNIIPLIKKLDDRLN